MMIESTGQKVLKVLLYVFLIITAAIMLLPFLWMLSASLKEDRDVFTFPIQWIPEEPRWANYSDIWTRIPLLTYILNTVKLTIIVTLLQLFTSSFAAYAFAKLRFKGRNFIRKAIFYAYLLPTAVLFIPMYQLVSKLGLINNKNALIIVYQTIVIPYACYMLISYFAAIPKSLEEAAFVDGCTHLKALVKVILPIAAPGIAVVATFSFTMSWNEYLYAMVLMTSPSQQTVPVGISSFRYSDNMIWGLIMSSSFIASLPAVILYMFAQRFMVTGLAAGGVKQ